MALRGGVAAIACVARERAATPFLSSKYHFRSHSLQRFTSHPIHQTGFRSQIRATQEAAVNPLAPNKENGQKEQSPENWKIKMLYDGDCPLCMREVFYFILSVAFYIWSFNCLCVFYLLIGLCLLCYYEVNMLQERNKQYGTIKFVEISSDNYSPEENQGLDYRTVMGRIHAILSDGTVVTDVEAFRKLYEQVGLGWVYAITKYEPIATIADAVYGVWAKYRLQITGRPPLEEVLEARKKKKVEVCGDNNACKM